AMLVFAGGIANPIISIALFYLLPEHLMYIGPASAFTGIMLLVHGWLLPVRCAPLIEASIMDMFRPLLRPMIVTLLTLPLLLAARGYIADWSLLILAGVTVVYGVVYAVLTLLIVISAQERKR